MIRIYYKDRFISFSQEKVESDAPGFQSVALSESGDLKIRINRFTANNKIVHLNFFGADPKRGLAMVRSVLKPVLAAGGVVSNKQGLKLFIFRNAKWDLPKGKAEKNETAEICAAREVSEECGIVPENLVLNDFMGITYHIYKQGKELILKDTHWYGMSFLGNDNELKPQQEEDIQKCVWVDDETIPQLMRNTYASIAYFVEKNIY